MAIVDFLKRHASSSLVLVIGIVVSFIVHNVIQENKTSQANVAFQSQARSCANVIVEGFSQIFFAIESIGALYRSLHSISPTQFDDFVAPLIERFPSITALGWVPQVNHDERQEFEQTAQETFPGFRVTEQNAYNKVVESGARQIYFPVYLIRPYEGNEAAHGFDLYSNQVRRRAIDRARDTGQTTSTARIRLVQERGNEYSVLIIHPVFQSPISTKDSVKLKGVASAVYRIGEGVDNALSQVHSVGLNIWLFDRSSEPDNQFLYFHPSKNLGALQQKTEPIPPANTRQYIHEFELGGRNYELILVPTLDRFEFFRDYAAWITLVIGLGITGLFTAYLELMRRRSHDLIIGKQALEKQISERKLAEQQLREVNRKLEDLSRKDSLMGIANRRYFDEHFQQEWLRAIRHGTSISLLIGDVDYFKAYNDFYGHVAGDKCLQIIGKILSDALERPGDLAARYGGEEIAIVLPSTSTSGARKLAEKIRLKLAEFALPHEQSSVANVVSVSIGCGTVYPTQGSSIEGFIQAVDAALYLAKQRGRNMTVVDQTMS